MKHLRISLALLLALSGTAFLAGCGDDDGLDCGAGTVERDGECVADTDGGGGDDDDDSTGDDDDDSTGDDDDDSTGDDDDDSTGDDDDDSGDDDDDVVIPPPCDTPEECTTLAEAVVTDLSALITAKKVADECDEGVVVPELSAVAQTYSVAQEGGETLTPTVSPALLNQVGEAAEEAELDAPYAGALFSLTYEDGQDVYDRALASARQRPYLDHCAAFGIGATAGETGVYVTIVFAAKTEFPTTP